MVSFHRRSSATAQRAALAQIHVVSGDGGSRTPCSDVVWGLHSVDVGGDLIVEVGHYLKGRKGNATLTSVKRTSTARLPLQIHSRIKEF